jgi:multidrug resistance efflux pump
MKLISLILGILLISVGGYVLIGEHLSGVSADAKINAQLATVRAPIRGRLTLQQAGVGSRVWRDQIIATIEDERIDTTRLSDLQQTEVTLTAEKARLTAQQDSLTEMHRALTEHARGYKEGRIKQLHARIAEAETQKLAAIARLTEQQAALHRANDLNVRGVQTAANLEKTKAAHEIATEELKAANQRITYYNIELEAAEKDTFLGDSYNDAPYSMQRLREIDLRLAELRAEHASIAERLNQAKAQVNAELERLNRLRNAELTSPVQGLLWEYRAGGGETINAGSDIVRLVDCDTVMITSTVSERLYNRLKLGDTAQFRLLGTSKLFEATVTRLAGSGASTIYENVAIAPSKEDLTRYDVTLSAPALKRDPELGCSVGRTGRVTFSGSPLDRVRQLLGEFGM